MPTDPWHSLGTDATLAALGASPDGLSSSEAAQRLARDGANVLSVRRGASWVRKLAGQFLEPLVVVLMAAAALSVFLGDFVDAAVIAAVVVLNGLLGFLQEHRAEQSILALSKTISPRRRCCAKDGCSASRANTSSRRHRGPSIGGPRAGRPSPHRGEGPQGRRGRAHRRVCAF